MKEHSHLNWQYKAYLQIHGLSPAYPKMGGAQLRAEDPLSPKLRESADGKDLKNQGI
jgi:hypothetical protein